MSGFLGVLDPATTLPHFRKLVDEERGGASVGKAIESLVEPEDPLLAGGRKLIGAVLVRLTRQEEALREVSEVLRRMNGSAKRLWLKADRIRWRRAPLECPGIRHAASLPELR